LLGFYFIKNNGEFWIAFLGYINNSPKWFYISISYLIFLIIVLNTPKGSFVPFKQNSKVLIYPSFGVLRDESASLKRQGQTSQINKGLLKHSKGRKYKEKTKYNKLNHKAN